MRMRKKKNLEEKLPLVEGTLFFPRSDDLNFATAGDVKTYLDIDSMLGENRPLEIEIGCGKGTFLAETAKRSPGKSFIGVELDKSVAYAAAKRIKDEGLSNAVVLCMKAEYLTRFLKEGCCERIYLNFSCPYPKNDYESHRLTSEGFTKIYRYLLAENGCIWQKTDDPRFFEYSIEKLSCAGFTIKNVSLDLHASGFEDNIVTEYEQRFVDMGKPIYRLEAYI